MATTSRDTAPFHRIRWISIVGGFMDGTKIEFAPGLNCIIGARGTGKTTVLEFIRFALDAMPDDREACKRIEGLVNRNLDFGRIEVGIEEQLKKYASATGGNCAAINASHAQKALRGGDKRLWRAFENVQDGLHELGVRFKRAPVAPTIFQKRPFGEKICRLSLHSQALAPTIDDRHGSNPDGEAMGLVNRPLAAIQRAASPCESWRPMKRRGGINERECGRTPRFRVSLIVRRPPTRSVRQAPLRLPRSKHR